MRTRFFSVVCADDESPAQALRYDIARPERRREWSDQGPSDEGKTTGILYVVPHHVQHTHTILKIVVAVLLVYSWQGNVQSVFKKQRHVAERMIGDEECTKR